MAATRVSLAYTLPSCTCVPEMVRPSEAVPREPSVPTRYQFTPCGAERVAACFMTREDSPSANCTTAEASAACLLSAKAFSTG